MAVKGIDVSHWQGNIDWSKVKAAGISFAIIKAGGSDDGFYTDSKWEANYKGAKANGIAVGAYYFVGPKCVNAAAGKADAERFIQLLKGKQLPERVEEALGYIPPAAFAALVANDLLTPGMFDAGLWPAGAPLVASLIVVVVARLTKSLLWSAIAGVAAYALLTML